MMVLHINSYYNGSDFYKNLYDKQVESDINIKVYVPVSYSVDTTKLELGKYTKISQNHSKYDRFLFHVKHRKIYKDIINKYHFEKNTLVHAHSLFSNGYIALKLKENYKIPYIVAVRNTDVNVFFKYMLHLRKLGVKILREAEKVIFLSEPYQKKVLEEYVSEELRQEILEKAMIIPNGIDDFWFNNKATKKKSPSVENLRLIYVGVINRNKNLLTTTKAIDLLNKEGYKTKFTVVGRIADKSLFNKIKDLSYLSYVAPKHKVELLDLYRENDIFVMPSIHETFGLVYAEAMSQGLPVIYTKEQGFDGQFSEGEVGYHVDCLSPEDLASKIKEVLSDFKRISDNCLKLCDKFDWNLLAQEYQKVYVDCYEKQM